MTNLNYNKIEKIETKFRKDKRKMVRFLKKKKYSHHMCGVSILS